MPGSSYHATFTSRISTSSCGDVDGELQTTLTNLCTVPADPFITGIALSSDNVSIIVHFNEVHGIRLASTGSRDHHEVTALFPNSDPAYTNEGSSGEDIVLSGLVPGTSYIFTLRNVIGVAGKTTCSSTQDEGYSNILRSADVNVTRCTLPADPFISRNALSSDKASITVHFNEVTALNGSRDHIEVTALFPNSAPAYSKSGSSGEDIVITGLVPGTSYVVTLQNVIGVAGETICASTQDGGYLNVLKSGEINVTRCTVPADPLISRHALSSDKWSITVHFNEVTALTGTRDHIEVTSLFPNSNPAYQNAGSSGDDIILNGLVPGTSYTIALKNVIGVTGKTICASMQDQTYSNVLQSGNVNVTSCTCNAS
ncbi:uncharacterized protein LOC134855005 [Symsagittifera roscoffensis]|uniref:uncharacterized protein LOC134855005 n=1 Tax=Symsagittifera roscoffensis TaxID=84072 RepID=UPI00307BC7F4